MKHKRTLATAISQETKAIVWERDNHRCIYCGRFVPQGMACSHFIKRSQGGKGIPENVVTACSECHRSYDTTGYTKMYGYTKEYLESKYEGWNIEKLKYNKYEGI